MKIEQKSTITIFGSDRLSQQPILPFNVIVAGSSRGGTSAVGAVMRAIGLNMGDRLHPTTHEDIDFADLINYSRHRNEDWQQLIEDRVSQYEGWSIKLPAALTMLHVFECTLPNPLYVIVVRNPFAVARSLVNRDETYENKMMDYFRGYSHAIAMYGDCFRSIGVVKGCFAICEYEKILSEPDVFVREFADLCRVKISGDEAMAASRLVSSVGYKSIGAVD